MSNLPEQPPVVIMIDAPSLEKQFNMQTCPVADLARFLSECGRRVKIQIPAEVMYEMTECLKKKELQFKVNYILYRKKSPGVPSVYEQRAISLLETLKQFQALKGVETEILPPVELDSFAQDGQKRSFTQIISQFMQSVVFTPEHHALFETFKKNCLLREEDTKHPSKSAFFSQADLRTRHILQAFLDYCHRKVAREIQHTGKPVAWHEVSAPQAEWHPESIRHAFSVMRRDKTCRTLLMEPHIKDMFNELGETAIYAHAKNSLTSNAPDKQPDYILITDDMGLSKPSNIMKKFEILENSPVFGHKVLSLNTRELGLLAHSINQNLEDMGQPPFFNKKAMNVIAHSTWRHGVSSEAIPLARDVDSPGFAARHQRFESFIRGASALER